MSREFYLYQGKLVAMSDAEAERATEEAADASRGGGLKYRERIVSQRQIELFRETWPEERVQQITDIAVKATAAGKTKPEAAREGILAIVDEMAAKRSQVLGQNLAHCRRLALVDLALSDAFGVAPNPKLSLFPRVYADSFGPVLAKAGYRGKNLIVDEGEARVADAFVLGFVPGGARRAWLLGWIDSERLRSVELRRDQDRVPARVVPIESLRPIPELLAAAGIGEAPREIFEAPPKPGDLPLAQPTSEAAREMMDSQEVGGDDYMDVIFGGK